MRTKAIWITVGVTALMAILVVVGLSGVMLWKVWRVSRPTTTIGRMRDLMSVLIAEQPAALNKQAVTTALMKYGRKEWFLDGWGRPFLIEPIMLGASQLTYRVTSLGSDGRRGPCCHGFVDSFEEDAVLEGDVWLQQWSFGHSPAERRPSSTTP